MSDFTEKLKTIGAQDAENFYKIYQNDMPEEFKKMLTEGNAFTYEDFKNFVTQTKKYNKIKKSGNVYYYSSTNIPYGAKSINDESQMIKCKSDGTVESIPETIPSSYGGGSSFIPNTSGQFGGKSGKEIWKMLGLEGTSHNDSTVQSLLTTIDINGVKVTINKNLAADLQSIVAEIKQKVPSFRFVVSSSYRTNCSARCNSRHQYGVAIDVNAGSGGNPWFDKNIRRGDWSYDMPQGSAKPWSIKQTPYNGTYDKDKCIWSWDHPVVKIFNAHGWGWGGAYGDVMHFSASNSNKMIEGSGISGG